MQALTADLEALERMLASNAFETAPVRIGAEQELFLVDAEGAPERDAPALLQRLAAEPFTTEVGAFNLEANLKPRELRGDGLSAMEEELESVLRLGRARADELGLGLVMTGILPSI